MGLKVAPQTLSMDRFFVLFYVNRHLIGHCSPVASGMIGHCSESNLAFNFGESFWREFMEDAVEKLEFYLRLCIQCV